MNLFNNRESEFDRRILMLEKHRDACDVMHETHKAHQKRHDDLMANLTESNVILAKSLNEVNITLLGIKMVVESDRTPIKWTQDIMTTFNVNKKVFGFLVAIALGVSAIVAAVRLIPW